MFRALIVHHLTRTHFHFERVAVGNSEDFRAEGDAEVLNLVHWWSCEAEDDVAACFLRLISRPHRPLRMEVEVVANPHSETAQSTVYAADCTVATLRQYQRRFVDGIMGVASARAEAICDDVDDMHSCDETDGEIATPHSA